jgi:predicted nucleic acid-binding protein
VIVVSDTSPLNYLVLIEAVRVLPVLYETVVLPSQVLAELQREQTPINVRMWADNLPNWVTVRFVSEPFHPATIGLDIGEAAALSLAHELSVETLLIDELDGRQVAKRELALSVVGTLGILLEADEAGILDASKAFERLKSQTTFRWSL